MSLLHGTARVLLFLDIMELIVSNMSKYDFVMFNI
jgi:hypothetical protein